jgi:hypothetical protein
MDTRFELEQQILDAWRVLDDIKILSEHINDDKQLNILIGIVDLYELKFDKLFKTFEKLLKEIRQTSNKKTS